MRSGNPLFRNKDLWNQFKTGNDNAFAELYKLNVDAMLDYGLHFTPLRDQVKDTIQDVFVTLYHKRDHLSMVDNVRLYLFISLKNALFSVFNKGIRHYQIETMEPVFNLDNSVEDLYIGTEIANEQQKYKKNAGSAITPAKGDNLLQVHGGYVFRRYKCFDANECSVGKEPFTSFPYKDQGGIQRI